ncbi:MAG TPA: RluA family pseudouridine synthase [Thermodesulfobacteriota bacterium]|nr:RluA family pseudouridine synthase [Thermodesulfobacteriota bacterium]
MNEDVRKKTIIVPSELSGKRADAALPGLLEGLTRSQVKRMIEEKLVLVGGEPVKPSRKLEAGDIVEAALPAPEPIDVQPEDLPVEILYEDEYIAIVNKPPGMAVHPGAGVKRGTLVNALLFRCRDLSGIGGKIRPGIVHRLDKDTSGVMVIAKNDTAHDSLVNQFKSRTVGKKYLAIVEGNLRKESGEFSSKIGRHPADRKRMSSRAKTGREALTHWKVIRRFQDAALVEAEPKTGRTHQIRVHFSENGYPILADKVYGHKKRRPHAVAEAAVKIGRQALHAYKLRFHHPKTGEIMEFTADLPEDMSEALNILARSGENTL